MPAVLAGDGPHRAGRRAADDAGGVSDTRVKQQSPVGCARVTRRLAVVVAHRDAGLDVVARQPHRTVADALVEHDAAGSRHDPQHAVAADPVGTPADERIGDLARDGERDERLGIDSRRAGSPWRTGECGESRRPCYTLCQKTDARSHRRDDRIVVQAAIGAAEDGEPWQHDVNGGERHAGPGDRREPAPGERVAGASRRPDAPRRRLRGGDAPASR